VARRRFSTRCTLSARLNSTGIVVVGAAAQSSGMRSRVLSFSASRQAATASSSFSVPLWRSPSRASFVRLNEAWATTISAKTQNNLGNNDQCGKMHVAAAIAPVFETRRRFRIQRLRDGSDVRSMNHFGQKNCRLGGSQPAICGPSDVTGATIKRCYSGDISHTTFFVFTTHLLGCPAKRRLSEARFAGVHQRPRSRQRFINDSVDIGPAFGRRGFLFRRCRLRCAPPVSCLQNQGSGLLRLSSPIRG
jgi:hypothetical protein